MPNQFKRIGLWGRFSEDNLAEPARQLASHLIDRGLKVVVAEGNESLDSIEGLSMIPQQELGAAIDLLIAIGGDGNLLRATRCVAGHSVPLIGVNRGRLGFLTDVKPDQMISVLDAVLDGDCLEEERMLLEARIVGGGRTRATLNALNDIVLQKVDSGRILDFTTTVDGNYVNTHGGDGLIVATPTGSTAYALSCGGPIIRPDADALVVVPICPHTLSDRPLVITSSSTVSIEVNPGAGQKAMVTCDGEELANIDGSETLEIRRSDQSVTLLHPKDYNYYELLRSKLNWGRSNRSEN